MKVDEELIGRVARLARLDLEDAEAKRLAAEMQDVLDAFRALDEFDSTGIRSSFRPIDEKNVLREDKPTDCLSNEEALKFTENKEDGLFIGPRTVE